MGLGPVLSASALLKRNNLTLQDIETWELNEAFATQVLGCLAAWNDDTFCREILGLDGPAGEIPLSPKAANPPTRASASRATRAISRRHITAARRAFSIRLTQGMTPDATYTYDLTATKKIGGVKFAIPSAMATGTNLSSDTYISVEEILTRRSAKLPHSCRAQICDYDRRRRDVFLRKLQ